MIRVRGDSVVASLLMMMGGSSAAKIITIISMPIITRLVTPKEYAVYATFTAVLTVCSAIATLRFSSALVVSDNERDASALYTLSILATLCIAIGSLAFLVFLQLVEQGYPTFSTSYIWWLLPVSVLCVGFYQASDATALRDRHYATLASVEVAAETVSSITKSLLAFWGLGAVGLVAGLIVKEAFGICALFAQRQIRAKLVKFCCEPTDLRSTALRYRDFPIYQSWSQLLLSASASAPLLLMSVIYDAGQVGFFALAFSVIFLPVNLVSQSASRVLYAESSDAKRGGERFAVRKVVLKVLTSLVPIALLASLILLFFSEELIGVIFGENWRPAGEYARALTVLAMIRMFATPMASLFNVFHKQKLQLLLNIARLILIGIVFIFISFRNLAGPDAVTLYACILSFYNVAIAALAWYLVNDSTEK